jgi:hypothetical protein
MGFNSTLWRPPKGVMAQLRHGQERMKALKPTITEKGAAAKAKADMKAEADRRFGQPHYGHGIGES